MQALVKKKFEIFEFCCHSSRCGLTSTIGVAPGSGRGNTHPRTAKKKENSISLTQEGSRLSRTVLSSVEQLRTLLDLMIDERVAELLEERNRLPRFAEESYKHSLENIDRLLSEYTDRKIHSWKLIDGVVEELTRYEIERREPAR